jgi:hypothetical protein
MSRIFSNEYHTFNRLFEYVGDNVFETLEFVLEHSDGVNEREDCFHSRYEINQFLVSFNLALDSLSGFVR